MLYFLDENVTLVIRSSLVHKWDEDNDQMSTFSTDTLIPYKASFIAKHLFDVVHSLYYMILRLRSIHDKNELISIHNLLRKKWINAHS